MLVKTLHRVPGERGGIGTVVVGLGLGLALTALWGLRHRRMSDSAGTSRRAQSAGECIRAGSLKPQRCPTTGSSEAKGVDYEWQRRGVSAGAPPALRRGNPGDSAPRNRTMNTLFATVRTAALAAAPVFAQGQASTSVPPSRRCTTLARWAEDPAANPLAAL